MKYFALLTKLGENLLAQATALGTKIELTHMAVGDGGGKLPTPDTNQTKLIAEKRRAAINTLFIDDKNKNQIIAEQIIPEQDGGWWIREIGLFDKDGNLVAVANCPETYKPQLAEGSGRTQSIRMVLIVSHTESVTLKIDPSVVLATREFVDDSVKKGIEEHEKSRKHPDASTADKGFVQLADTLSVDNTKAITPKLATEINQRATNAQTTANTASIAATDANNNANSRVPSTRKVNNKPLSTDINLTADDVGAYDKSESDTWFQPKGNYAPAGNYQPAGDYATNAALNNGLALKFDKTGGTTTGHIISKGNVTAEGGYIVSKKNDNVIELRTNSPEPCINVSKDNSKTWIQHSFQNKSGVIAHVGDYGFGGNGSGTGLWVNWTAAQVENFFKTGVSSIWRNQQETTPYAARYGTSFYVRSSDTFWNMNVNHASGDVLISNGLTGQAPSTFKIAKLFSTLNTTSDRNGCLRIANASTELSDCQVGVPLPWPQATAPVGYLICNGQWFNKTNYPLLAKAYPSGQLPDLRSEFIRGLDAGRNVDSGRAVLSAQGDAIRNITGEMYEANDRMTKFTGAFYDGGFVGGNSGLGGGNAGHKVRFDASRVVPTANENRPRNIAFLYIVRAA